MARGKFPHLDTNPGGADGAVGFQSANDLESLGITSVNEFLARIPAVHQRVNQLVLRGFVSLDEFNGKVVFAFERKLVRLTVLLTKVRAKIPGERIACTNDVGGDDAVRPYPFPIVMGVVKVKRFDFFRRGVLFAACVIDDEEGDRTMVSSFGAFTAQGFHEELHAAALHPIDAPRRFFQELRYATQMAIIAGSTTNLGYIFSTLTQNNAVHHVKQVVELRAGHLNAQG